MSDTLAQHRLEASLRAGLEVSISGLKFQPPSAKRPILDIPQLRIPAGQFASIVGLNGAGKSTLLKLITGDIDRRDRKYINGVVTVGGQNVLGPINTVIDGVGVVHQNDKKDLIYPLSIAQNIAIRQMLGGGHKPKFFSTPGAWRRGVANRIGSLLPGAPLDISTEVGTLSGGERQMLNVAIAVHFEHENNPCGLLVLDEHTASLDHIFSNKVMTFTIESLTSTSSTAIMVTHRYDHAICYGDRVLVMHDGKIIKDLYHNDEFNEAQLRALAEGAVT